MKKLVLILSLVSAGAIFPASGGGSAAGRSFADVHREVQDYEKKIADDQKEIQNLQKEIEGIRARATYQNSVNLLSPLREQLSALPADDDEQYSDILGQIEEYEKTLRTFNEKINKHTIDIEIINRRVTRESGELLTLRAERDAAAVREGRKLVRVVMDEESAVSQQEFKRYPKFEGENTTVEHYINSLLSALPSTNTLQQADLKDYDFVINLHKKLWDVKLKDLTRDELQNIRVQKKPKDWDWALFV